MIAERSSEAERTVNRTVLELEGDRTVVVTRTFDAPARLVFDAWTKADLVKQWWAPKALGVSMVSCTADVRPGGAYRYVILHRTGDEIVFSGKYLEVERPTRLVYTQVYEPIPEAGETTVTVTFEERDGRTAVVMRDVYLSPEVRDGVIASGMERGLQNTMEQLEELVRSLA
jgi:uncharacterized protein YndB with AHSA1/START domain